METGTTPTGASTPEGTQVAPAPATQPGVNPAQPSPTPTPAALHAQSSPGDISAVIASYENRVRSLMSEKDKALHERNQAIAQLAELQQTYTALQEQTSTSLTQTANAAQTAITEAQKAAIRVTQLEGELQKAQLLLKHPDLAPYERYIPTAGTAEEQQKVIDDLKAIREADLAKIGAGQTPIVANPLPVGGTQPQPSAYFNLLGQRTNLPPQIMAGQVPIPGSTPASMSPTGAASTPAAIDQMLREAMASGDPGKFQEAVSRAASLANADIQTQMSRG